MIFNGQGSRVSGHSGLAQRFGVKKTLRLQGWTGCAAASCALPEEQLHLTAGSRGAPLAPEVFSNIWRGKRRALSAQPALVSSMSLWLSLWMKWSQPVTGREGTKHTQHCPLLLGVQIHTGFQIVGLKNKLSGFERAGFSFLAHIIEQGNAGPDFNSPATELSWQREGPNFNP